MQGKPTEAGQRPGSLTSRPAGNVSFLAGLGGLDQSLNESAGRQRHAVTGGHNEVIEQADIDEFQR